MADRVKWGVMTFEIEDDGDSFQVAIMEDGVQIAGMIIPDDGTGEAFELARDFARAMTEEPIRRRNYGKRRRGGTPKPPIANRG